MLTRHPEVGTGPDDSVAGANAHLLGQARARRVYAPIVPRVVVDGHKVPEKNLVPPAGFLGCHGRLGSGGEDLLLDLVKRGLELGISGRWNVLYPPRTLTDQRRVGRLQTGTPVPLATAAPCGEVW